MREIKFRGKRKDIGEWVCGNYWVYGNYFIDERDIEDGFIWRDIPRIQQRYGDHYQYYDVDPATVGQYTGLKDKHGREIYTDDIIRIGEMGGEAGRVIFDTACLAYMVVNEHQWTGAYRLGDFDGSDITIIGNIHDNPELLEAES